MSSKSHTEAERIAGALLGRTTGAGTAARMLSLPRATVERWMATVDLPDEEWPAIERLLLARGAEMAATGRHVGLSAILAGAGIAGRNRRMATLIRRRDRADGWTREPAVPPEQAAFRTALAGLSTDRRRLLGSLVHRALRESGGVDPEAVIGEASMDWPSATAAIADLAAMGDDEVAARVRAIDTAGITLTDDSGKIAVWRDGHTIALYRPADLPERLRGLPVIADADAPADARPVRSTPMLPPAHQTALDAESDPGADSDAPDEVDEPYGPAESPDEINAPVQPPESEEWRPLHRLR